MIPQLTNGISRWHPGLAALTGVVGGFGLAPYGYWPLTVLALAGLGRLLARAPSRGKAAMTGWLFGVGYFAFGLVWLAEPFLVDAATHGWMIPFALSGMAGGLALFWALAVWLGIGKYAPSEGRGGRHIWRVALFLALSELARGYVFTGFPWAGFAQIWIDTPVARGLAWFGPYGLGTLTLLVALPLGAGKMRSRALGLWFWGGSVVVLAMCCVLPVAQTESSGKTVRILQPNAPQHQKWDPDFAPLFFERQLAFSAQAPDVDLVVWPETAVPWPLDWADRALVLMAEAAAGAPLIAGFQREDPSRKFYNSAVLIDSAGQVSHIYDKHHLVPFGEYMPFGALVSQLGIEALASRVDGGYASGAGPQLMDIPGVGSALPLLCYEAVFPQDMRSDTRPDFLLAMTNDAWFGQYSGPYQHLVQARMRAIEMGLPMVRAANTGVSAMIGTDGALIAYIPLGKADWLDAELPKPASPTLYAQTGDWLVLGLLIVSLGLISGFRMFAIRH